MHVDVGTARSKTSARNFKVSSWSKASLLWTTARSFKLKQSRKQAGAWKKRSAAFSCKSGSGNLINFHGYRVQSSVNFLRSWSMVVNKHLRAACNLGCGQWQGRAHSVPAAGGSPLASTPEAHVQRLSPKNLQCQKFSLAALHTTGNHFHQKSDPEQTRPLNRGRTSSIKKKHANNDEPSPVHGPAKNSTNSS